MTEGVEVLEAMQAYWGVGQAVGCGEEPLERAETLEESEAVLGAREKGVTSHSPCFRATV